MTIEPIDAAVADAATKTTIKATLPSGTTGITGMLPNECYNPNHPCDDAFNPMCERCPISSKGYHVGEPNLIDGYSN